MVIPNAAWKPNVHVWVGVIRVWHMLCLVDIAVMDSWLHH